MLDQGSLDENGQQALRLWLMKVIFSENHLTDAEKSKLLWEFLYEFIKICSEIDLDEDNNEPDKDD